MLIGPVTRGRVSSSTKHNHDQVAPSLIDYLPLEVVDIVMAFEQDQYIYAIGGYPSPTTVERFDVYNQVWQPLQHTQCPRVNSSIVAIGGRILVIGGGSPWQSHALAAAISAVEMYVPEFDCWMTVGHLPRERFGCGAVSVGSDVVLIGGSRSGTDLVFRLEEHKFHSLPRLLPVRAHGGAVCVNGGIYVMGGRTNYSRYVSNQMNFYDPRINTWLLRSSMLFHRWYFGVARVRHMIYVFGGGSGFGPLKTAEVYSTEANTWTRITDLTLPRWGCSAVTLCGRIYLLGGYVSLAASSLVESYDPVSNTWRLEPPMLSPRDEFSAVVM